MPDDKSVFGGLRTSFQSEEEVAIEKLFPAANRHQLLQMTTEIGYRSRNSLSMLGLFRRKYKSKVLTVFQEEFNVNGIPIDRKSRLELSEIMSKRASMDKGEDD